MIYQPTIPTSVIPFSDTDVTNIASLFPHVIKVPYGRFSYNQELDEWCREHCPYQWCRLSRTYYRFMEKEHAALFKLFCC